MGLIRLLNRVNRNLLAVSAQSLETNAAVYQSEQCVVAATANVGTGMDLCAALSDQDVTSQNELTVSTLSAQALRLGVTTVLCRAAAFLMSHSCTPP